MYLLLEGVEDAGDEQLIIDQTALLLYCTVI